MLPNIISEFMDPTHFKVFRPGRVIDGRTRRRRIRVRRRRRRGRGRKRVSKGREEKEMKLE